MTFVIDSIEDLSNGSKSCQLHLLLPVYNAYRWNPVLKTQEQASYSCFIEWGVQQIAKSVDKRWKLINAIKFSQTDLVNSLFQRYQVRYANGTKWNQSEKQSTCLGYYVFQRDFTTQSSEK